MMIEGAATPGGTSDYARQYPALAFQPLGGTAWKVSPAGFGCYRVGAGIEPHGQALTHALSSGVNLIDTSTNYTDGGSESLVGQVLRQMIEDGRITRQQVVVISKVGYLQGANYVLSQERKAAGQPFPELVPYGQDLEHCIHPEFIADQLTRSLERLQLDRLDVLLLHNPEYFLGWARKQGVAPKDARDEFYGRIEDAFKYLETQVRKGSIQCYGISSNTFPAEGDDPEFVCLDRVLGIARGISPNHHFKVIEFPLNVFEPGAMLAVNQPDGHTVISYAREHELGVVINRPLNAFTGNRLVRLAEIEDIGLHTDDEIIAAIGAVNKSEVLLWRKLLPLMELPAPLYHRIKEQAAVGNQLKHYWRNFGSYERWRQFKEGYMWPHLQGVFDYLEPFAAEMVALRQWIDDHHRKLEAAAKAVGSLYAAEAVGGVAAIKKKIKGADARWDVDGITLSQLAVRVLRSTSGVSSVLVGMRQIAYVDDVLEELRRPVTRQASHAGWQALRMA